MMIASVLITTLTTLTACSRDEVSEHCSMLSTLSLPARRKQKRSAAAPPVGSVQAVVVAPSRELAMQIVRVAQSLLPPGARGAVQQCIGGANPHRQACRASRSHAEYY